MNTWASRRLRHPPVVTITLIAAVSATAMRLGVGRHELPLTIAYRYGFSGRGLAAGRWWLLATSQLLTRDAFMAVSIIASLAIFLGAYELRAGSRRAAVVTVVCALAAPAAAAGLAALGSALGLGWCTRALSTVDYGASTITAGGGGALVALCTRRVRVAAVLFVASGLLLHHQFADWEHLVAFPLGAGLSLMLGTPAPSHRRPLAWANRWRWALAAGVAPISASVGVIAAGLVAPIAMPSRPPLPMALASVGPAGNYHRHAVTRPHSPARIIDTTYPSPSTGGRRRVLVLLPPGYDSGTATFPAVELLHGRPGGPDDLFVGADLLAAAATPGVAGFVAFVPDGHGPVVADGDFANTSRQRLGTAISDDLNAWAHSAFRIDTSWGIAGISAGGYGATLLGSAHPNYYRRVCAIGGSFEAGPPVFTHEPQAVRAADSPILHATATGPATLLIAGSGDPTAVAQSASYATALHAVGQPAAMRVVAGVHDWSLFRRELPVCLRFLVPRLTASPVG